MAFTKNKWVFSLLWINLAVVFVMLILLKGNQVSSGRELVHTLAYALVYANLTGLLGTWLLGGLAERFYLRKYARSLWPRRAYSCLRLSAVC